MSRLYHRVTSSDTPSFLPELWCTLSLSIFMDSKDSVSVLNLTDGPTIIIIFSIQETFLMKNVLYLCVMAFLNAVLWFRRSQLHYTISYHNIHKCENWMKNDHNSTNPIHKVSHVDNRLVLVYNRDYIHNH